jgi:hypothetical protein
MNARTIRSTLIGSLGVALALASVPAWAITYRVTDLGVLPGTDPRSARTTGTAMNASGQVTGTADTADESHALWTARRCGTSDRVVASPSTLRLGCYLVIGQLLRGDTI